MDFDPRLDRFAQYWESLRHGDQLPARRDLDALEIPDLLSGIAIIAVTGNGSDRRYRFRLCGSRHSDVHRRELTGTWLDEVFPGKWLPPIAETLEAAMTHRGPYYARSQVATPGRDHITYQRVLCPLADDGETIDTLVGMYVFETA